MMEGPKLPIDHPRYRIPGTNVINFSKWIRENDTPPPPGLKVGDLVIEISEDEIERVYQDCDGTALYNKGAPEYCYVPIPNDWDYDTIDAIVDEIREAARQIVERAMRKHRPAPPANL